jgi:hypothetical protein
MRREYDPPLDDGIERIVEILQHAGVETFESCDGTPGHAFPEPTVRFHGGAAEGFRALAVAIEAELPVNKLRRIWRVLDAEPEGPYWEMTFSIAVSD